jgi:nucleoprotein TPR
MAQERYAAQARDLESLHARNSQLHEQYTRIDVQSVRVEEELSEAKSRLEQLRNECSNLRAQNRILEVKLLKLNLDNNLKYHHRIRNHDSLNKIRHCRWNARSCKALWKT